MLPRSGRSIRTAAPPWAGYAWTAMVVTLTTAAAWWARSLLALPDLVALYLLAIMLVAALYGRGPAVMASALSVVAYDVFFIEPLYTFRVYDQRHLLTFALMFTVGLVTSELVLRIRRQEAEVRAASLRARTEEIRSSLLSAVSHDLRTPLASITGASSALREQAGELDPAAQRELIDTISDEARRLERLVVNLLDMTKLEAGPLELKRDWVPIEEAIGSALARIEPRLGERPMRTELGLDLPLVRIDPVLIEHALVNLLENALKHTPAGTEIRVAARADADALAIEVADRGPGLPAAPERLFEKFVRAAAAGVDGAGLGLAIARGIARAHRGEVLADNRPDGGAVFTLRLPLEQERPPEEVSPLVERDDPGARA